MRKIIPLLLLLTIVPLPASAAGLVTCTGPDCTFCSLVQLVQVVMQWIFMIIIPLGILVFAFAGFRLVVSRGDASALKDAKKLLTSAIIGLILMFSAWTIVDTLLKVTTGGGFGFWNPVTCPAQASVGQLQNPNSGQVNVVNGASGQTSGASVVPVGAANNNTGNSGYQGVVNSGATTNTGAAMPGGAGSVAVPGGKI